jgi:hypothetical protein
MLLNIYLTSLLFAKTTEVFFCTLGGRTQGNIFLVQKLACLALEQGYFARKNCQANITIVLVNENLLDCTGRYTIFSAFVHS